VNCVIRENCEEAALYREVFDRIRAQAVPERPTRKSLGDVRKEAER
jgi:hypothetical protein